MMCALSGTLFIYQGQELGMVNFPETWDMSEYKDVDSSNYYKMIGERTNQDPAALKAAKTSLQHLARDHARVPISWNTQKYNGFSPPESKSEPWMRALPDAAACNAQQQLSDKNSVLAFWKRMVKVRKDHKDLLIHGDYEDLDVENLELFVFKKTWQGKRAVVVCNFNKEGKTQEWKGVKGEGKMDLLMSSVDEVEEGVLKAFEGRIYLSA
jgi:oligo-1,6-glucosidase